MIVPISGYQFNDDKDIEGKRISNKDPKKSKSVLAIKESDCQKTNSPRLTASTKTSFKKSGNDKDSKTKKAPTKPPATP